MWTPAHIRKGMLKHDIPLTLQLYGADRDDIIRLLADSRILSSTSKSRGLLNTCRTSAM